MSFAERTSPTFHLSLQTNLFIWRLTTRALLKRLINRNSRVLSTWTLCWCRLKIVFNVSFIIFCEYSHRPTAISLTLKDVKKHQKLFSPTSPVKKPENKNNNNNQAWTIITPTVTEFISRRMFSLWDQETRNRKNAFLQLLKIWKTVKLFLSSSLLLT